MFESNRRPRVSWIWLAVALLLPVLSMAQQPQGAAESPVAAEAPASQPPPEAPSQEPTEPESPSVEPPETEAEAAAEREAEARDDERPYTVTTDTQVHFMSDLTIDEDEMAREAVAILGDVEVRGKVRGDAVAVMGSVTVTGQVTGAVTAIGDDVILGPGAEVIGDVISVGGRVERHPDARVLGQISEIDLGPALEAGDFHWGWRFDEPDFWDMWHFDVAWELFWSLTKWLLLLLVTSFILLVARRPVERVRRVVEREFWKAGLVGLVTWLLLVPVLLVATIILAISIIGIPLLLILWPLAIFVLLIACFLGYTAAAYALGGWLGRRFGREPSNPYLALLLGVLAIQLLSFVADLLGGLGGPLWFFALMFALTGWFVRFAAWTVGLGGALLAFADRGRRQPPPNAATSAPPATPPVPPSPSPSTGGSGAGSDPAASGASAPTGEDLPGESG